MAALSSSQINSVDNEKLVRPTVQLQTLLKQAGADKDVYTLKEFMFYLGKYIMQKELYDKTQQHIIHCGKDELGSILGVDSFSIKEPRVLFAMISKNLRVVRSTGTFPGVPPDSHSALTEPSSQSQPDGGPEEVGISANEDSDEDLDEDQDSDVDRFSVEFEVESIDSDPYDENDEASVSEDQDSSSSSLPSTSGGGGGGSGSSSQEESPELERSNGLEPCVICQSRPKNGCIVHGRTGHLMSCYTCAKKLKNRNKLCPVCREPITSVVLTYFS